MSLKQYLLLYSVILIIGMVGGLGDLLIYQWAKQGGAKWIVSGLAFWFVGLTLFGVVLRCGNSLGFTFVLSAVVHIILVLGWDLLVEKTQISRLEMLGLLVAVLGILLMEVGHAHRLSEVSLDSHSAVQPPN